MNNSELNEMLKKAAVPEPSGSYWEEFPGRVMAQVRRRESKASSPARHVFVLWMRIATACMIFAVAAAIWSRRMATASDAQIAQIRKYFEEIQTLFPHQVKALRFDQQGPHFDLADEPSVPNSPPLYLKICGPSGCLRFVTFSGQQIVIDGDICEVLANSRGEVILAGSGLLWSSGQGRKTGSYNIEARKLSTAS